MNKTGPIVNAFFTSVNIRPGRSAPSLGVNAFIATVSLEFRYLTSRSSINCETSIDGENPVSISFTASIFDRMSATVRLFHPGERTS